MLSLLLWGVTSSPPGSQPAAHSGRLSAPAFTCLFLCAFLIGIFLLLLFIFTTHLSSPLSARIRLSGHSWWEVDKDFSLESNKAQWFSCRNKSPSTSRRKQGIAWKGKKKRRRFYQPGNTINQFPLFFFSSHHFLLGWTIGFIKAAGKAHYPFPSQKCLEQTRIWNGRREKEMKGIYNDGCQSRKTPDVLSRPANIYWLLQLFFLGFYSLFYFFLSTEFITSRCATSHGWGGQLEKGLNYGCMSLLSLSRTSGSSSAEPNQFHFCKRHLVNGSIHF